MSSIRRGRPQLAFEFYATLEPANYLSTLYRDPAILDRGRTAVQTTIARAKPVAKLTDTH